MKNNKALGQHWLKNRAILEEIAELTAGRGYEAPEESAEQVSEKTEVDGCELCVEIGPGLGFLTSSLFRRFKRIIAVEFDGELARKLPGSFPGKDLEVVNEDILKFDFSKIKGEYVVAGNIPYYITSPIIEKVLTVENLPKRVVLLMQKEVAERIISEKETGLSLFVKNRAKVWAGPVVLKGEFTPPPKVDSQVIIMEPHAPEVNEEVFELIRKSFCSPRKKLVHNLAGLKSRDELIKILEKIGVDVDARPGDLHLNDYQNLFGALS